MYAFWLVVQSLGVTKGPGQLTLLIFLWGFFPLYTLNPSHNSFLSVCNLCPMFGYQYLLQFQSAAG